MVDQLRIRSYPTKVLRGWVFIWMGEDAPAAIEEDVPPELLEGDDAKTQLLTSYTYWQSNWMVAIENQGDSHNYFYAHRNSLMQLTANRTRPRTPIGARSKLINDRALFPLHKEEGYYSDASGKEPYQIYYPGVDGHWPIGQWRRWLWTLFKPWYKLVYNSWRMRNPYKSSEEWAAAPGIAGWHLPCMVRVNFGPYAFTRYSVAVTENMSRIIYFHHRRKAGWGIGRLIQKLWFYSYFNWWLHYNFSAQDGDVAAPCRYWTDEYLSSTDSHLVMLRKLVTERSRDVLRRRRQAAPGGPIPLHEAGSIQRHNEAGNAIASSLEEASTRTETVAALGFVTGGKSRKA
jgi:phenylpropionate dioxygenase-like ring-hydroxylating dioxygenase large terminal subunit